MVIVSQLKINKMFTVEIRINGTLINHIYGHNEGDSTKPGEDSYRYELYEVETRKVTNGTVTHARRNGINALIRDILTDSEKMKGKGN
jgi:hypothetical protein